MNKSSSEDGWRIKKEEFVDEKSDGLKQVQKSIEIKRKNLERLE